MTYTELRETLSKNLKRLRKDNNLTQEKLAEKTELSTQTIADIEGCRTWVSDKTLVKIAEILKTTPAEILETEKADFIAGLSEHHFLNTEGLTEIQRLHIQSIINDIAEVKKQIFHLQ